MWVQSNAKGETYAPFRLDMKNTKATWLGSLPHGWRDQLEARNTGTTTVARLEAVGPKRVRWNAIYHGLLQSRRTSPFITLWPTPLLSAIRTFVRHLAEPRRIVSIFGPAPFARSNRRMITHNVRNSEVDYPAMQHWKTFPERLEDAGVSWKIYQNEINLPTGMTKDEDGWLSNFSDNPIEWFTQFHGRFSPTHRRQSRSRWKAAC